MHRRYSSCFESVGEKVEVCLGLRTSVGLLYKGYYLQAYTV
jgi:hypothetical protein